MVLDMWNMEGDQLSQIQGHLALDAAVWGGELSWWRR